MPEESEFQPLEFKDTPDPRAEEREKIRQTVDRIADNLKDPNKVKAGFLERVSFQLSGSTIDFLAVTHSPELLNSSEAVHQIEDAIRQADVVVLESSIIEKQWDTKDNPNRQIIQTDKGFYTKIQEKLYEQSKIMMILDPQTPESMVAVKQAHTAATGAGILTGVLAAREAILAIAKKNNPDKYGRRGFLKAIAEVGGLISTGALAEQLYSVGYKAEGVTYYDPKFQLDDQLLLGFDNYRDLVVGQQLAQICAESPTPLKIAVIYGASHLDGMYRAATQDLEGFEKAIKTIPKKILDMSSLPKARIYKPEPASNGWRQLTN